MDEVKIMSRAGESVGKAVGTGLRNAREGASRASKAGLEASKHAAAYAEQELAQRGVSTDDVREMLARKTTGMSRKELAKAAKQARKDWARTSAKSHKQFMRNTEIARKELAKKIDPKRSKGRRKWPWLLLALVGIGAAAAHALSRRPEELPLPEHDRFPSHDSDARPTTSTNGSGPESTTRHRPATEDSDSQA